MKKVTMILMCLFISMFCAAQQQDSLKQQKPQFDWEYYYPYDEAYFEFGIGGLIPTDDSNSFFEVDVEFGKYINQYWGVGMNLKISSESEYNDKLNYIGPKFRFRVNYDPRNTLDLDIHAGFGYGWYRYNEGTYYDTWYYTMNYVVPNIGLSGYVNLNRNISLGFEPSFMWYISTNKDKSENVGVWSLMGKIRFRF